MNFDEWLKEEYGDSLLTNRMRLSLKAVWDYQQKKLDCCREENKALLESINELKRVTTMLGFEEHIK